MHGMIVEIRQFRIARGIDEQTFLNAADGAQSFLNRERGFVSRELIRTADGLSWIDIVRWRGPLEAQEAARNAVKDPNCLKFFGLMEKSTIRSQQMELSKAYQ